MANFMNYGIIAMVLCIIFGISRKNKKKDLDTNTGNVLKLPKLIFIIGLIDFLIFTGFAVYFSFFNNQENSLSVILVFLAFALLGLVLIYFYFVHQFTYDEEKFIYRKFYLKKINIKWEDISSIKYSTSMQYFKIICTDGTKAYLDIALRGFKPFAKKLLSSVDHSKMDPATVDTLYKIKDGQVVGTL